MDGGPEYTYIYICSRNCLVIKLLHSPKLEICLRWPLYETVWFNQHQFGFQKDATETECIRPFPLLSLGLLECQAVHTLKKTSKTIYTFMLLC